MNTWKFNKGEWAEAYVFLYILANGRLYGAKTDLTKDDASYIDVLKVIRDEVNSCREYERKDIDGKVRVIVCENETELLVLTPENLAEQAVALYNNLKTSKQKSALEIPSAQSFLESIFVDTPKANLSESAKLKYGAKTDIIIQSEDSKDHFLMTDGYSIKSFIGSAPTLFNAAKAAGFTFRVDGCTEEKMHLINSKDEFLLMIEELKTLGCHLLYDECRDPVFAGNILLEDSNMDIILKEALLLFIGYYSEFDKVSSIPSICDSLAQLNPLTHIRPAAYYRKRMTEFLLDSFAGMTASKEWDGRRNLSGGYIDVSKDGSMLFFRAISDEVFCNYLYKNTVFDRPDRGRNKAIAVAKAKAFLNDTCISSEEETELNKKATKCDFGYVYKVDDAYYMDINFQVRFRK